ncbi:MAG: hypothetical protein LIO76_03530 [Clostridiales bacterium]|nr:hypothetical protein [Clostridiales bacterium]
MRQSNIDFNQFHISWEVGSAETLNRMPGIPMQEPFSKETVEFLNTVSRKLLSDPAAKSYPDVVTFAFWIRKASVEQMRRRFTDETIHLGRGVAFHVAPSNVPVNYAYSMAAGLICGNANVVRIPSKEFPQITIINRAVRESLQEIQRMRPYIGLVRYGHEREINDALSSFADVRVIWGGDNTIQEFRKSPLKPRAAEITFADRYSLAVIDSDAYLKAVSGNDASREKTANDFYNDTYLTDQNACTSPRAVIWMGSRTEEAKEQFWGSLSKLVRKKYEIQGVQAVNKLTSVYLAAAERENIRKVTDKDGIEDNRIVRVKVDRLDSELMELKDNSGYFFEYDCRDVMELQEICDDARCQTISYIGCKEMFLPLLRSGIKGVDRIVPVGKTMDFDLIWDGYNLFERMTRVISVG